MRHRNVGRTRKTNAAISFPATRPRRTVVQWAMPMQLQVGYELIYDCPQPTPMMLMLNVHHTRANDIVVPDVLTTQPPVPLSFYRDGFGNWCTRIVAPA